MLEYGSVFRKNNEKVLEDLKQRLPQGAVELAKRMAREDDQAAKRDAAA